MLRKGTENASKECDKVVDKVEKAMKINYFSDEELIKSQTEKYQPNGD